MRQKNNNKKNKQTVSLTPHGDFEWKLFSYIMYKSNCLKQSENVISSYIEVRVGILGPPRKQFMAAAVITTYS